MQKNDKIVLEITDVTSDGSGVGKYEGMAVFVPMTAVGDTALVHVVKVKKTYAYGKLESIIKASDDRCENDCSVFKRCGGCVYRHITYSAECRLKQNHVENCIKRIGGIDINTNPIIPAVSQYRYRNKAQFPLSENGKTGFFANHSHNIIECEDCLLQPLEFAKISQIVSLWISKFNISIYNELHHKGILRHLYLRKAEKTGEIMVVIVANSDKVPHINDLVDGLIKEFPQTIKSIVLNVNTEDTNVILGKKCINIYGQEYITDILCGVKINISALSFYQVNHDMTEALYKKAQDYACPQGKTVLDLYCGAGTIGLSMANVAKNIIGVEIIPEAILNAKENAKNNGIDNARFICADASDAAKQLAKEGLTPDVVILDPPRKGCNEEVLTTVANDFASEKIVYVSCDPATLARDCKIFENLGYTLIEYTPVDLFPRTGHVETVALLIKGDKNGTGKNISF